MCLTLIWMIADALAQALPWRGQAHFQLEVMTGSGKTAPPHIASTLPLKNAVIAVEVGKFAIAPVGAAWSDVAFKTDDLRRHRHQALREDESAIGVSSSEFAPVNPKDHGAVGNCTRLQTTGPRCYVDDTAALQQAIDYAQLSGRALLIPAGIYAISKPLFVHCTGALELVHHNGPVKISFGTLCTGVEGAEWYHPLRISGEGIESTVIMATAKMEAVLMIGKTVNVSSSIHVDKLHLDANRLADHGLLSQGVIRSRFSYVAATRALQIGMKLQNGFILYVQDCTLFENMLAGLWLNANTNGVEVTDCELSGNEGVGVYMETGNQVSIARNMIEGNGGPGIFVYDSIAVDLQSNYFESNCDGVSAPARDKESFKLIPPPPSPGFDFSNAKAIVPNADIVVSGAPLPYYGESRTLTCTHIQNSVHTCFVCACAGTSNPVHALRISGSRFDGGVRSPHNNSLATFGSLVLMIAAGDVVLEGNQKSYPGDPEPNVSLLTTGPGGDGRLFNVSGEVTILGGFGLGQAGVGLIRSLSEDCKISCGQPFHQYHIAGTPQANFAKSAANASEWMSHNHVAAGLVLDGVQMYTLTGSPSLDDVVVLELNMATMPTLQGQLTYFGLRTTAAAGVLRLAIDRGDGWLYGREEPGRVYTAPQPNTWRVQSFAQVLPYMGTARFALASNATVDVGQVVVAKVGAAWSDVAFKTDDLS